MTWKLARTRDVVKAAALLEYQKTKMKYFLAATRFDAYCFGSRQNTCDRVLRVSVCYQYEVCECPESLLWSSLCWKQQLRCVIHRCRRCPH